MSNQKAILKSNVSSTSRINIRSEPSLNHDVINQGYSGDAVTILGHEQPPGDSHSWYQIRFGDFAGNVGWVRDDVLQILQAPESHNPSDAETIVHFVTNSKTVRIYGSQPRYMNVYDNKREETELNGVPTLKLPEVKSDKSNKPWISYIAIAENTLYSVRFIPFGEAELILSDANDGRIIQREKGFRASGNEYQNLF